MFDFLFGSGKSKIRHAIASDEYASRYDQGCVIKLREIHHTLERIEAKLPDKTPGSTTAGTDRTLTYVKQHAERTLEHLNTLEEHLRKLEKKLDERKHTQLKAA